MNERIRQLAEQVGYKSTRWDTTEQFEQFLDEFAELIVRECIMLQYRRGVDGFGILEEQMIKQHFGIES